MNDAWNLLNPYWRQVAIDANPGFMGLPAASATRQMGDFLRSHDSRPLTSNPSTPLGPLTLPSGGLFPMLNRNWDEGTPSPPPEANRGLFGFLARTANGEPRGRPTAMRDATAWGSPMLPIQSMLGSVWPNGGPNTYALQSPVDENDSSGKNHGYPNALPWADPSYAADQWQSLMGQGWRPRAQAQFKSEDGSEPVPAATKKINEAECLA
jgi:hypothetical protein